MSKIALIYGSETGNTEDVAKAIIEKWPNDEIELIEACDLDPSDFENYDNFILGLSTWNDGDLQSDWEDFFDDFEEIDFSNKTVAVFGLGDQSSYPDYFVDGMGIVAQSALNNGAKIIGNWPTEGYDFSESKAKIEGKDLFYGLAIDEDNESELTDARLDEWISIIVNEFN